MAPILELGLRSCSRSGVRLNVWNLVLVRFIGITDNRIEGIVLRCYVALSVIFYGIVHAEYVRAFVCGARSSFHDVCYDALAK
jgi:hypothetical protein